ncbi:MAG: LPS export ABC transporter ATP-binding protein [Planctomycetota bacterium]|nr:LPS export ABC transporter ATP-binding protein [Planctomycetota bacterium]
MSVLKVEGLAKSFGGRKVVNGVSFEIAAGELVGLLGPNGAGKTTCFRMTCGMLAPDSGKVYLNGEDVTSWPMYRRAKDGNMGYLPQQSSVFSKLTTQQNLLAMMELLGMPWRLRKEKCAELLDEFEITNIRKSKAGSLSGGERRRLEIARCLVSDPKIIMLDEPFAGIDPVTVQSIQQIIRRLCDEGIAILITDHAAREILQITERTYVVSDGQILCSGSAQQVIKHPEVKAKYLGEIDGVETRGLTPAVEAKLSPDPNLRQQDLQGPSQTATTDRDQKRPQTPAPGAPNRKVVATRQTLLRKSDLD